MTRITDLVSLNEFFTQCAALVPGIEHFLPLSNGEKAIAEIAAYYTDAYMGTTAFFQVAENRTADNGAGLDSLTFLCSLTVAMKPQDGSAPAGLVARDQAQKLLLQLLGQVKIAVDELQEALEEAGEDADFWITPGSRMFPIGALANVELEGYYIDVDVTIPANHLLFVP